MAEIIDTRQQSLYGAGQIPQQQAYGIASAPAAPVAQAQPQTQDPLFDALLKQITSGLGTLPVNSSKLQEQVNNYSTAPGGRAYLEELVSLCDVDKMPPINTRPNVMPADGYINTNWSKLNLEFTAKNILKKGEVSTGHTITFNGSADGVFVPSNKKFTHAEFHYDNDVTFNQDCTFKVTYLKAIGMITVVFSNLIGKDFADLFILTAAPLPPFTVVGGGTFKESYF